MTKNSYLIIMLTIASVALIGSVSIVCSAAPSDEPQADGQREQDDSARDKGGVLAGAYYFGGWSRKPNLNGIIPADLLMKKVPEREPVTGWYDDTQSLMDDQIKIASEGRVGFFVFDWYRELSPAVVNYAPRNFMSSPEKHRMKFAVGYINTPRFAATTDQEWDQVINEWITYFKDPQYLKVDGQPVLFGPDAGNLRQEWNGPRGAARAIERLREKVREAGFKDVLVGAGVSMAAGGESFRFANDGYDFFTGYSFPPAKMPPTPREQQFSELVQMQETQQWDGFSDDKWRESGRSPISYIPPITTGWDRRPILSGHDNPNEPYFVGRTPQLLQSLFEAAKKGVERNRTWRVYPRKDGHLDFNAPGQKMVVMYAWNEVGEGGELIPRKHEDWNALDIVKKVFDPPH